MVGEVAWPVAHQDLPPHSHQHALRCQPAPPCPVHLDVLGQRTGVGLIVLYKTVGAILLEHFVGGREWPMERLHLCAAAAGLVSRRVLRPLGAMGSRRNEGSPRT